MELIKCKDKFYVPENAGNWAGATPVNIKQLDAIKHRWHGKKISMNLWNQIVAFFEWSYKETKSETVVTLFYHEEHGWTALVLPQRGYTSMTIRHLEDHPNRIPTFQRLGGGDWTMFGSVHHHCSGAAFASGTDTADEISKEGLHITVGHIGSAKYSIDGRASFRKELTSICWDDWFELDERVLALGNLFPPNLAEHFVYNALIQTPTLPAALEGQPIPDAFPAWWKDNVIKVEYATATTSHSGSSCVTTGSSSHSQHYNTDRRKSRKMGFQQITRAGKLESEFEWISKMFNISFREIGEILDGLNESPHSHIINSMIDCSVDLKEAIEIAQDLNKMEKAEENKDASTVYTPDDEDYWEKYASI